MASTSSSTTWPSSARLASSWPSSGRRTTSRAREETRGNCASSGVIDEQLRDQLTRVTGIRNRMVHDYVGVAALDVHQAARLLHAALPRFVTAYQQWLRAGFPATGSGPAPSAKGVPGRRGDRA